jgi:hypothetical protein
MRRDNTHDSTKTGNTQNKIKDRKQEKKYKTKHGNIKIITRT